MRDQTIGSAIKAIRTRRRWRQVDLAARARVSPRTVGRLESGDLDGVRLGLTRQVVDALGGSLSLDIRWHGGDLDRLLSARHSSMHEAITRHLLGVGGWAIWSEASFSIYGERGVIDALAFHERTGALLVVELKTEIADVNALVGQVDRYRRLAPQVARERGWQPDRVSVWVAVADSRTNRGRLSAHVQVLRAAFPDDGRAMRGWLPNPTTAVSCLSFLQNRHEGRLMQPSAARRRVRACGPTARRPGSCSTVANSGTSQLTQRPRVAAKPA